MRRNLASAPAPHCSAELRPDAAFLLCRPPPLSCGQPRKLRQSGLRTPRRKPHRRPPKKMHQPSQALPPSPYRHLPRTDVFPFFPRVTTPPRHGIPTSRCHGFPTLPRPSSLRFLPFHRPYFPSASVPASVSASVPFPSPHRSLTTPPSALPPPRRCATLQKCGIFPPLPLTPAAGTLKHTGTLRAGCKSPPAVNPLARGSPRARFQGKSADPVQVRGRR